MSKTYKNINFEDYDSYDDLVNFEKLPQGTRRKKAKGHQPSRHQFNVYDEVMAEYDDQDETVSTYAMAEKEARLNQMRLKPTYNKTSETAAGHQGQAKKPLEFGPNTHTFMGDVKIDFDRVSSVEKINSEFKGKNTFGIKFVFKGKNGTFRIIWFNQRMKERDMVFDREYAFWRSLK